MMTLNWVKDYQYAKGDTVLMTAVVLAPLSRPLWLDQFRGWIRQDEFRHHELLPIPLRLQIKRVDLKSNVPEEAYYNALGWPESTPVPDD